MPLSLAEEKPLHENAPVDWRGAGLDPYIEAQFPKLRALPLFKNVPPFAVLEILRQAHIANHKKGAFILTQSETLSHFYIVLDGWVRLFRNSQEGREVTLQVLGPSAFLFQDGITGQAVCPMNVVVVEGARLLAIPLNAMQYHFMRSGALAENLLDLFTQRASDILSHLENLTLRSAKDRVGFFFLKRWMETNPKGADLTLPFDKSLIAAYLDLRPETFSRILKEFQQDGFTFNGTRIQLPGEKALCRFCDPMTALRCPSATAACREPIPPHRD